MSTRVRGNLIGGPGTVAVLLGPALLMFGLFMAWPAADALRVSMSSWTGFSPQSAFTGLENYRNLAGDERFRISLKNTFYFVIVGGIGHFFFALLFAFCLNHPRFAAKKFYQTVIFFPSFVSVVGVAILWARLYDYNDGLINRILQVFGGRGIDWLAAENAMNSIVLASIWAGVGGQMIVLLAGMKRIPPELLEAARIDGANEWQVFRHVTLPMLKDVLYVALSLWLIGSMQVFGLVQSLAGPGIPVDMETISTYQYAISFNARDNIYMMGRGTAMAVTLVLCIVLLVSALRLLFGKRDLEY